MRKKFSNVQIIAIGFLVLILIGALLLMLPFATREGKSLNFGEALFTATSASCVTGLVVVDTATTFTLFGQIVILALIQIGGLGFLTMAIIFLRVLRRKIGLREKEVIIEGLNSSRLDDIPKLTAFIFRGVAVVEGAGALLLAIRFIPTFGPLKGIWYSVFHSVSAFCNAGFDLMGTYSGEYSSFTAFAADPVVVLTLIALILIGGLGFFVWLDVIDYGFKFRRWRLTTKIVMSVSAILVFGGALIFFFMEKDGTVPERILNSLFDSVTPRTAGFNTVDTAALSGGSKLLTVIFMLIGGCPGSTAGGIKVTTIAVLIIFAFSQARHERNVSVFQRTVKPDVLKKAMTVFFYNLTLAIVGALIIMFVQNLQFEDVIFEVFSAIDTVGMTTGITRELLPVSRVVIMALMYLGRVGSTSFAMALLEKRARPPVEYPEEDITVG